MSSSWIQHSSTFAFSSTTDKSSHGAWYHCAWYHCLQASHSIQSVLQFWRQEPHGQHADLWETAILRFLGGISKSCYKGLKLSLIIMPTWGINSFVHLRNKGQRAKKAPFWNGHTDYKINTKTWQKSSLKNVQKSAPPAHFNVIISNPLIIFSDVHAVVTFWFSSKIRRPKRLVNARDSYYHYYYDLKNYNNSINHEL